MRTWALATSPDGMGIPPERFWELTWREFDALHTVYIRKLERWALERADFKNAHFGGKDTPPWTIDEILGRVDRRKRIQQHGIDQMAVRRENLRLAQIKPGAPPPDNLPEWAKQFAPRQ